MGLQQADRLRALLMGIEGGLLRRVLREGTSLQQQLLTIAGILQTSGFMLPPDPDKSSAAAELRLESHYQDLEIQRWGLQSGGSCS